MSNVEYVHFPVGRSITFITPFRRFSSPKTTENYWGSKKDSSRLTGPLSHSGAVPTVTPYFLILSSESKELFKREGGKEKRCRIEAVRWRESVCGLRSFLSWVGGPFSPQLTSPAGGLPALGAQELQSEEHSR